MPNTAAHKTLLIFRKDVRHLWPEIALTLALTVACAVTDQQPPHATAFDNPGRALLLGLLRFLLPVAWCVLIARDVHDESLVGDLQFWLTRPYGWPSVLAAKLLMVVAFVLLPFMLEQMFILHQAALPVFATLPLLAYKLLLIFCFLLLPMLAVSAVTSSITRMILYVLGSFIYIVLVGYLFTLAHRGEAAWFPQQSSPYLKVMFWPIPLFSGMVVLLQYAKRRTAVSIGILFGLIAILTAIISSGSNPSEKTDGYPDLKPGDALPFHLALDPNLNLQAPALASHMSEPAPARQKLSLPILISGIAPNHAIRLDGYRPSTSGVSGWTSEWQRSGQFFVADPTQQTLSSRQQVEIPSMRVLDAGRALHLRYSITEFAADPVKTVTFTGGAMDLPQKGHCDAQLLCSYALRSPNLSRATWIPCNAKSESRGVPLPVELWFGLEPIQIPNSGISPIMPIKIFDPDDAAGGRSVPCVGDTITFTSWRVVGRHKVDFDLAPFDPNAYVVPSSASRQ